MARNLVVEANVALVDPGGGGDLGGVKAVAAEVVVVAIRAPEASGVEGAQ